MKPTRVIIADDHTLVLEAFEALLSRRFEVVGTAANGRELIRVARKAEPDVIVTDISMPELSGLDAGIKLLNLQPDVKIIFLTVNDDPDVVARVFRAGAKGFLLKCSAPSELIQAIEIVAEGGSYVTPLVTGSMLNSLIHGNASEKEVELTFRQREILQLLAEGKTMKQSAQILHVTPRTIAFHKYRIMNKLAINNTAELVRYAFKSGMLQA